MNRLQPRISTALALGVCQIAEDDDAFLAVYEQAVAAYGKEAVDAILDQIPAE